jgi:ABC-type Fe3+-hydroxamate transport system substrate-binding protein
VGTSEFSDYPEQATKIPRVGDSRPLVEKIISLKPDLVLNMERETSGLAPIMERAKIKLKSLKANTLSDFTSMMDQLGLIFRASAKAEVIKGAWKTDWQKIRSENPPTGREIAIVVENQPLTIAGTNTFLSEVVEACGFKNLFGEKIGYPQISREVVLQKKPKLVLFLLASTELGREARDSIFWQKVAASNGTKFHFANPNILSRLTPRLPLETMALCEELKKI